MLIKANFRSLKTLKHFILFLFLQRLHYWGTKQYCNLLKTCHELLGYNTLNTPCKFGGAFQSSILVPIRVYLFCINILLFLNATFLPYQ